jgi:hypothetical protein
MKHSMQSHNKQHHYMTELARLKKEREEENRKSIDELLEEYVTAPRKKKRSKSKLKK